MNKYYKVTSPIKGKYDGKPFELMEGNEFAVEETIARTFFDPKYRESLKVITEDEFEGDFLFGQKGKDGETQRVFKLNIKEPFEMKYDGKPLVFEKGKRVDMNEDMYLWFKSKLSSKFNDHFENYVKPEKVETKTKAKYTSKK